MFSTGKMDILVSLSRTAENGGADRDQTDDLVVANDALYQLSYCPESGTA